MIISKALKTSMGALSPPLLQRILTQISLVQNLVILARIQFSELAIQSHKYHKSSSDLVIIWSNPTYPLQIIMLF